MLRKLIKSLIPNRGEIFLTLFIDASINVNNTAILLIKIYTEPKYDDKINYIIELKNQRNKALDINKKIIIELNKQFITPIDRGDIFHIADLMLKLTKRIIKINDKLKIYNNQINEAIINSLISLESITQLLYKFFFYFKKKNDKEIKIIYQKYTELDENILEELNNFINNINDKTINIIPLKEILKSIELTVDTSSTLYDVVMRIYVKEI